MKTLTPSKQHYIKEIHILSSGSEGVHITEIAKRLGVTKASVCTAMKVLQKENLVYRNGKHLIFLTEAGKMQALKLIKKFGIIKKFLIEVLHVNHQTAELDSCALEHVISNETLHSMCRFLGYKQNLE